MCVNLLNMFVWGGGMYILYAWHVEGMSVHLDGNLHPTCTNADSRRGQCAMRVAIVSSWLPKVWRNGSWSRFRAETVPTFCFRFENSTMMRRQFREGGHKERYARLVASGYN